MRWRDYDIIEYMLIIVGLMGFVAYLIFGYQILNNQGMTTKQCIEYQKNCKFVEGEFYCPVDELR